MPSADLRGGWSLRDLRLLRRSAGCASGGGADAGAGRADRGVDAVFAAPRLSRDATRIFRRRLGGAVADARIPHLGFFDRLGIGAVGSMPYARRALVEVHDFMLADGDDVAVVQIMAPNALRMHIDAVRAVQILDHATIGLREDLAVVPADELAVDLQVVVRGAACDGPARPQFPLHRRLAFVRYQNAADNLTRRRGGLHRALQIRRAHAV